LPEDAARAFRYQASPGFFDTLGIRVQQGRAFTWQDTADTERVAVVNEALARKMFGDRPAVGHQIRYGPNAPPIVIVGVVETGKYQSLTEAATPAIFEPMLQRPNTTTVILVRSTRPDAEMTGALRAAVQEADPALPLFGVQSVNAMLGFVRLPMQAAAIALGAFGMLAAALAATGIHGIVVHAVSRRRRELAIRVAIGAPRPGVVILILRRTALLVATGTAAGLAVSLAGEGLLAGVVYAPGGEEASWIWAAVVGLVVLVAAAACAWPTWRALSVDPVTVLAVE
jgi:ABC-type lipoprotein release transport system permease subunit